MYICMICCAPTARFSMFVVQEREICNWTFLLFLLTKNKIRVFRSLVNNAVKVDPSIHRTHTSNQLVDVNSREQLLSIVTRSGPCFLCKI